MTLPIDALLWTVPVLVQVISTITWPEVVNNLIWWIGVVALFWIILRANND